MQDYLQTMLLIQISLVLIQDPTQLMQATQTSSETVRVNILLMQTIQTFLDMLLVALLARAHARAHAHARAYAADRTARSCCSCSCCW